MVNLKEYIESRILHERELRESHQHAVEGALTIQAEEYERRLELLNGEHGRLTELTRTFLRQETFEAYLRARGETEERLRESDTLWRREVNKQLDEQRGASNRQTALLAIALTILSIALRFWP